MLHVQLLKRCSRETDQPSFPPFLPSLRPYLRDRRKSALEMLHVQLLKRCSRETDQPSLPPFLPSLRPYLRDRRKSALEKIQVQLLEFRSGDGQRQVNALGESFDLGREGGRRGGREGRREGGEYKDILDRVQDNTGAEETRSIIIKVVRSMVIPLHVMAASSVRLRVGI